MERCPNCGATVRAGAKFCTTCGMRLPEMPAAELPSTSSTTSRSPFESTSSVATARWPTERPSQAGTGDATSGYAAPSSGGQASGPSEQPATEEVRTADAAPAEVAEPSEEEAPSPAVWPPLGRSSSWDSSWRTSSGTGTPEETGETDDVETPAAVAEPEDAAVEDMPVTGTEVGHDGPVDAGVVEAEAEAEVELADDSLVEETVEQVPSPVDLAIDVPAEADTEPEQQVAPMDIAEASTLAAPEQQPGPADLGTSPASGGGLDRAYVLIDELRATLSSLTGGAEPAVDTAAIADDLEAARTGASDDEFEKLRVAIASARERPRDIDTMLDVSGRLDAITSLDDAYQRLASIVDEAITSLRASTTGASTDE